MPAYDPVGKKFVTEAGNALDCSNEKYKAFYSQHEMDIISRVKNDPGGVPEHDELTISDYVTGEATPGTTTRVPFDIPAAIVPPPCAVETHLRDLFKDDERKLRLSTFMVPKAHPSLPITDVAVTGDILRSELKYLVVEFRKEGFEALVGTPYADIAPTPDDEDLRDKLMKAGIKTVRKPLIMCSQQEVCDSACNRFVLVVDNLGGRARLIDIKFDARCSHARQHSRQHFSFLLFSSRA